MMTRPMRGVQADLSALSGTYLASVKIDGLRAWVKDGVVLSKTGKPIPSPTIQKLYGGLHGLDGELVIGRPYKESPDDDVYKRSRGPLMRKTHCDEAMQAMFCAFDRWDLPDEPAHKRVKLVDEVAHNNPHDGVVWIVPHTVVGDGAEVSVADYLAAAEAHAYEGAMIRRTDGGYKYGTSTAAEAYLLKLKRYQQAEARIVGFVEGERNENEAYIDEVGYTKRSSSKAGKVASGTLGAFEVIDLISGVGFRVAGGKGLTAAFRQKVWDNRPNYEGKILRYLFQEYGTDKAPRIPQFDGFRDEIDISELARGQ